MINHLLALSIALLIDRVAGDPPSMPHPVRWFGRAVSYFENNWNKGQARKAKGMAMVLILSASVLAGTCLLTFFFYGLHPAAGVLFEAIVIFTAIAQRSLKEAAQEVEAPLAAGDLEQARLKLSYIVGRDTEHLQEAELVRGTVETVAENTSDGVTAPLFWAAAGGAPLALLYRLVNTLDSMVGYRNERFKDFGWASAKLDDLVNWIPARITAFAMLLSHNRLDLWRKTAADAAKHPSPNSGWGEAASAYLLGIQLGGINTYKGAVSDRARMGVPSHSLKRKHISEVISVMDRTVLAFLALLWLGGILIEAAITWL
ncbi:cobalamin biosynthesis protein CobD [Bacillus mangrovi]|uniref:Cobalamin biosynthesis protein CobD n=1 Tax=Metabacillus mangrovi TaxID=1491830 RepID=A0A7X2V457_9BACI|nr:adenosylcobinamide-phosphate synthase CbiB [Metabacillus mangrovi]MTH53055.1 cobalamin biosynthesis protein CobD [Metabacillus mangrovi]